MASSAIVGEKHPSGSRTAEGVPESWRTSSRPRRSGASASSKWARSASSHENAALESMRATQGTLTRTRDACHGVCSRGPASSIDSSDSGHEAMDRRSARWGGASSCGAGDGRAASTVVWDWRVIECDGDRSTGLRDSVRVAPFWQPAEATRLIEVSRRASGRTGIRMGVSGSGSRPNRPEREAKSGRTCNGTASLRKGGVIEPCSAMATVRRRRGCSVGAWDWRAATIASGRVASEESS